VGGRWKVTEIVVEIAQERDISLRDVFDEDLIIFSDHQRDPTANWMAAFTSQDPTDWAAFSAKWERIIDDETITVKTITCNGIAIGNVSSFIAPWSGQREVSFWLGRSYWGHGIATQSLVQFLEVEVTRPLHARAAWDNMASIRVLEKCGFVQIGRDKGFANGRGEEIEEVILALNANHQEFLRKRTD